MTVIRPALRYHGGKWVLAPWIIDHLPRHSVYVEPFGGAASVLLRKPRSYAEVYNDLDGAVVSYFRVLRDAKAAEKLHKAVKLTPFSRDEFISAYSHTDDAVEAARRLLIRSFMGFGSDGHNPSRKTGFRSNSNRSGTTPARDWANYPPNIRLLTERLRGVVIENRDARDVMLAHDGVETLHYVDPPYVHGTRSSTNPAQYVFEMSDEDHIRLAEVLRSLSGMVVLSGYRSDLYERLFSDWKRVDRKSYADGARERIECLWLNAASKSALAGQSDLLEFAS